MGKIDLVCLGDSIVYGYGTYPQYAWPRLAAEKLGITILNKGENGDTSDGMNVRFIEDVVWNHPEEVFIMAGSNDILMGIPKAHTCESMERIIDKAREADIPPMIGIPIMIDGEMLRKCWFSFYSIEQTCAMFKDYREWLLEFCSRRSIPVVDFQAKYGEYLKKAGVKQAFIDGVHPTREGYAVLADIFCDTYKKIHGKV